LKRLSVRAASAILVLTFTSIAPAVAQTSVVEYTPTAADHQMFFDQSIGKRNSDVAIDVGALAACVADPFVVAAANRAGSTQRVSGYGQSESAAPYLLETGIELGVIAYLLRRAPTARHIALGLVGASCAFNAAATR
jgi:hypothetical protein